MNAETRRVIQWIIDVRGEVPLVEELATAEDVQSFVCGHVRWDDGMPGPAVELEEIDFKPWIGILSSKRYMPPCSCASSVALIGSHL